MDATAGLALVYRFHHLDRDTQAGVLRRYLRCGTIDTRVGRSAEHAHSAIRKVRFQGHFAAREAGKIMRFSERYGFQPIRDALQVDGMDEGLTNGLWSLIHIAFFKSDVDTYVQTQSSRNANAYMALWLHFFKLPVDNMDDTVFGVREAVKRWWMQSAEWFERYDMLEFIAGRHEFFRTVSKDAFTAAVNDRLEAEQAAYRLIGESIVRLTDEQQVQAVEQGLADTAPLSGAHHHLEAALSLLSNRADPDFANSVKESISAIESVCRRIVGQKATLGDALKRLESAGVVIHPALKDSFLKVYGYTSDEDGIRHAASDTPDVGLAEATYFLVSSSAFVSYLVARAADAGLALDE